MESIEEAYRGREKELRNYIRAQVSSRETTEDILHDIFERAIRANMMEPIENIVAWLFHAASNRVVDWYRKKFRKDISFEEEGFSLEECLGSVNINFSDAGTREAVEEELLKAIDELPADQREIVLRQSLYGETFREIAEEKEISVNTLLARKRYALDSLRRRLSGMSEIIKELNS